MELARTRDKCVGDVCDNTSYYRHPMCVTSAHSIHVNDQSECVLFVRWNILSPLLFILSGRLQLSVCTHWTRIAEKMQLLGRWSSRLVAEANLVLLSAWWCWLQSSSPPTNIKPADTCFLSKHSNQCWKVEHLRGADFLLQIRGEPLDSPPLVLLHDSVTMKQWEQRSLTEIQGFIRVHRSLKPSFTTAQENYLKRCRGIKSQKSNRKCNEGQTKKLTY